MDGQYYSWACVKRRERSEVKYGPDGQVARDQSLTFLIPLLGLGLTMLGRTSRLVCGHRTKLGRGLRRWRSADRTTIRTLCEIMDDASKSYRLSNKRHTIFPLPKGPP